MADEDEQEIQIVDPEDEEGIPVELDEPEEEKDPPLVYDEDDLNLIKAFKATQKGTEWLKKAIDRVHEDWDREFQATSEYRERFARDWKVFSGDIPKLKDPPFEHAANAHVPIMLRNIVRTVTRASGELFGDWNNVFGVVPVGPDDSAIAEILTTHGNWQIRTQIPDFRRQIAHRGLMMFFVAGDCRTRSYWNGRTRLNCHEVLTPDDFVTPYTHVTTAPDFSDLPWYAMCLQRYRHELEAEAETEGWYDLPGLFHDHEPRLSDAPESPLDDQVARIQGHDADDTAKAAPHKLIWWEGWMSIPPSDAEPLDKPTLGVDDTTGEPEPRQRFLQIVMHYETKRCLRLRIHEQANWKEKERFRIQSAELEQYQQATAQHQEMVASHNAQLMARQQEIATLEASGAFSKEHLLPARQTLAEMSSVILPPPPPAPAWLKDPEFPTVEPPKKEPILMFAHSVCIEPLVGNIGLSYGRQEADVNRAADVLLSQFIDAGTLANIKTFLAGGSFKPKDALKISPGKINVIDNLPSDIKNALLPLDFGPANPQLMELVGLMMEFGEQLMDAPQVLSGAPGKSGETYRGIATRIEQATKQLSVITSKYRDHLEQILRNNALLNATFMEEEEVHMIANHLLGQAREIRVGRAMYERNYLVEIRADLRFSSQAQKIEEADEIVQMGMKIPILAQNPQFLYHATKKALEARGRHDMAQLMGPPPPPGPPPGMMPPGAPPGGPPGAPPQRAPGGTPIPGAPRQPQPNAAPQPPKPPAPPQPPQGPNQ